MNECEGAMEALWFSLRPASRWPGWVGNSKPEESMVMGVGGGCGGGWHFLLMNWFISIILVLPLAQKCGLQV